LKPYNHTQYSGYPYEYCPGNSALHRIHVGWKLALTLLLCVLALAARHTLVLVTLAAIYLLLYVWARIGLIQIWKDIRLFIVQITIVVVLYLVRYGTAGIAQGLCTGLQIMLFFLPGAVLLRTTSLSQIMGALKRWMPRNLAFVIFTSIRFVPLFVRELHDVRRVQQLRGAPVSSKQLLNPANWWHAFPCLVVPLMIRAMQAAHHAALSAEARALGPPNPMAYRTETLTGQEAHPERPLEEGQ
jgi:energy-coupling factor transport system permease protein